MTSYLRGNPYLCDKQYKLIKTTLLSFFIWFWKYEGSNDGL